MPKRHCALLPTEPAGTAESRCHLRELLENLKEEPELVRMVLASAAPWWTQVCKWLRTILCDVRPPLVNTICLKRGVTLTEKRRGIGRLAKYFSITGIRLNDLGFHAGEAKQLCAQIWACETLTSLNLDMCNIPNSMAHIVFRYLPSARKLKRLTLLCSLKTPEGLDRLLGASLGALSSLQELNVRIVPQEGSRMPALKNVLRRIGACHNMEALTLSSMQIKDDDLLELMQAWVHMRLSRLNLTGNCLSKVSIQHLVNSHSKFSELYLSGNPLGSLGPEYLKPTFPSLRILSLNSTNIGAQGLSVLAQDAHRLLNLEHLKISNNRINREGGPAIVQLLTECNALKRVNLSSNSLGSAVDVQMHSAIACTKLCFINLRHNNLSSQQVDDFIDFACNLLRVQTGEMEYWI